MAEMQDRSNPSYPKNGTKIYYTVGRGLCYWHETIVIIPIHYVMI